MKKITSYYEILDKLDNLDIMKKLEKIGRVCYKSEDKMSTTSSYNFISNIIKKGHESILEHYSFSVRFVVDRGISHEIVRHRLASYAQESTRYCNYSLDKFNAEITVIEPEFFEIGTDAYTEWENACIFSEESYFNLLDAGVTAEQARTVLPTSLKTELVMTANIREWRHFLRLRCANSAHPQIRIIARKLLAELKILLPILFKDIEI